MTVNGGLVAAGGLLALAGGLGLGHPAGFAVAAACAILLLTGLPLRPLPGRTVRLELTVDATAVQRGTAVTVTVAADVRAVAHLRAGAEQAEFTVGGRTPARWQSPPLPRGRLMLTVDRVVAVGALALWRRRLPFTGGSAEIVVHPRHVRLADPPDLIDLDEDGRLARIGAGTGSAFAGLRAYQAGDDLRHVDWAASARSADGELYLRQYAPSVAENRVVVLDPGLPGHPGPARLAAFEVVVDLAYSFTLAGTDLALHGEQEPVPGREGALDVLTGLAPRSTPAGSLATVRPGGVVAVVTASPENGEELRRAYGNDPLILGIAGPDSPPAPGGVVPVADLAAAAGAWSRWAGR
jgi:uncharacterized protein (DUF58 family)